METRGRKSAAIAFALFAAAGAALAAGPKVEIDVSVQKEVVVERAGGARVAERRPVDVARPGDVLVYTLRAVNVGDGPALDARVDDPVPEGTVLVPDSVETAGSDLHASVDGGRSWARYPILVDRKSADGRVERVPAPAESYTHLRWILAEPLEPGGDRNVSFKVRIL